MTVSLYRVQEKSCDGEDVPEACPNDYYPNFKIDGKGCTNKDDCTDNSWDDKKSFCCASSEADTSDTHWSRTVDVDTTKENVEIELELWDQDGGSPDDPISWVKGNDDKLVLQFNRTTCTFTSGSLTADQGAGRPNVLAGQSEGGGDDSARGFFTITTPSCREKAKGTDSDGDGIMDAWETPGQGLDIDNNGTVDVNFADEGALPYRKDLFVDSDYLKGVKPDPNTLSDVKKVFADAPVDPYPDPNDPSKTLFRGINLHIDEAHADEIPETPRADFMLFRSDGDAFDDDFNDFKSRSTAGEGRKPGDCPGFFGTAADRSSSNCVNILAAKRQVYRYMIFAKHFSEFPDSSGDSEFDSVPPKGGNDFIVTVGGWDSARLTDAGGKRKAEAATFMHEFGHTLSLLHGGNVDTNCKPNYPSVMNYLYQFPIKEPNRPLDYTSGTPGGKGTALGLDDATDLNEDHLDESHGVFGTPSPARDIVFGIKGKAQPPVAATGGAINWNGESGIQTDIPADINYFEDIAPESSKGGCSTASPHETLGGFDDWAHIQYNPRLDTKFFGDGARPIHHEDLTENTVRDMSQKADVTITKTADQAEAVAGDTVSYTTTVKDLGPGKAQDIKVTDTLPDGSKVDRTVPDLDKDGTNTVTPKFTYLVPCATTDGSVLTNNVTVTANDTNGVADPYVSDNSSKATTTVKAPVLTLGETATPTVDAGDPITYTLTYQNTGGAAASNVTITDTLPAGVYYSKPLDTGAGPQPTTVARNTDGTTTLTWTVASLGASSGAKTIAFTARTTLLSLPGDTVADSAKLSFSNANGCTFDPKTSSATTTITAAPVLGDPRSRGHWNSHPEDWTAEVLARIQATDQRFDELDPFGLLTAPEVGNTLGGDSRLDNVLRAELLTMYLNLGSRQIGAGTLTDDTRSTRLGLATVRDVALFAQATLDLPLAGNEERYKDAIHVVSATHGGDSTTGGTTSANPVGVGGDLGTLPKPQVDTDHDGVADSRDACPTAAGTQNGCPARLFARLIPARVSLRARRIAGRRSVTIASGGFVVPPAGVKADQACRNGHVTVVVQAGSLTVSRRAVRLGADCAYKAVVRIANARVAGRVVSVRAYFTGNDVLKRRTSHLRLAH